MSQHTRTGFSAHADDGLVMLAAIRSNRRHRPPMPVDVASLCGTLVPAPVARRGADAEASPGIDRRDVQAFLDLLLDEDGDECETYLLARSAEGSDPQELARRLLAPAAVLVGDYWRMDVCDFMKVTVVMGRIQRLFWRLASLDPPRAALKAGRTALLVPLPPEQHGFGLALVDDALRRAGWHVDCCGQDEGEAFFDLLAANRYAMIGISMSGVALASALAPFIRKSRKKSRNALAKVLVGGSLFVEKPELAFDSGADFLALDAASAVRMAEEAVAQAEGTRSLAANGDHG